MQDSIMEAGREIRGEAIGQFIKRNLVVECDSSGGIRKKEAFKKWQKSGTETDREPYKEKTSKKGSGKH